MKKEYKENGVIVYLSLGSNLGEREVLLKKAIRELNSLFAIIDQSSVYETPPWGFETDNNFLNMCISISTIKSPLEVLEYCDLIEKKLGRTRSTESSTYTSRPIDIDIIYYGKEVIQTEHLEVPHPRMYDRNFVLYPLLDIAPDFIDPVKNMSIQNLKDECNDDSGILLYTKKLLTIS